MWDEEDLATGDEEFDRDRDRAIQEEAARVKAKAGSQPSAQGER